MAITTQGKRHRIAHQLIKADITKRGQLGNFDKLSGVYGLGPVLSKQLAKDLETLNPMQWVEAYPRIEPTRQIIHTNHTNEAIEELY